MKKFKKIITLVLLTITAVSAIGINVFAKNKDISNNISIQNTNSNIIEVCEKDISIQYDISEIAKNNEDTIENNMEIDTEDTERISF